MVHIVTPYMKHTSPCFQGVMKYVMVDASLLLITTVFNLCRCLRIGTIVFSFIFLPQNGEPLEWRLSNKQIQISLKRRAVATFQNLMLRKITLNRVILQSANMLHWTIIGPTIQRLLQQPIKERCTTMHATDDDVRANHLLYLNCVTPVTKIW